MHKNLTLNLDPNSSAPLALTAAPNSTPSMVNGGPVASMSALQNSEINSQAMAMASMNSIAAVSSMALNQINAATLYSMAYTQMNPVPGGGVQSMALTPMINNSAGAFNPMAFAASSPIAIPYSQLIKPVPMQLSYGGLVGASFIDPHGNFATKIKGSFTLAASSVARKSVNKFAPY